MQEELQNPEFLQLLANARGLAVPSAAQPAGQIKAKTQRAVGKQKREKPVRLKDIAHEEVAAHTCILGFKGVKLSPAQDT